jgi:hypothetical protein
MGKHTVVFTSRPYLPLLLAELGCSNGLTDIFSVFSTISLCLQHHKG